MIDIALIRENPDLVRENIKKKFQDKKLPLVDEVLALDSEKRALQREGDERRAKRNTLSKSIGALMKEGKKDEAEREKYTYLRTLFSSLLITGPFSIVLGFNGGLMALNDRLKLRSMVVGEKDDKVFIASEEAAIRMMEPEAENIWAPAGGEPVIVKVKDGYCL